MRQKLTLKKTANPIPGILFLVILSFSLCFLLWKGISYTSQDTLTREKQTLEQAVLNGAVHSYAINGRYPESLEALLEEYHITYDKSRFAIEYIPNGSNLIPSIFIISFDEKKEASYNE
ncbi:MAG: hypothetical protein HUJ72_12400 [Blautia sp.]|nr:hypothetical protein [Blautia sp.]